MKGSDAEREAGGYNTAVPIGESIVIQLANYVVSTRQCRGDRKMGLGKSPRDSQIGAGILFWNGDNSRDLFWYFA